MTTKTATTKTTEQAIAEQLTEGTGRALCDSGGAYGRNWQRNQKAVELTGGDAVKHFEGLDESTVQFDIYKHGKEVNEWQPEIAVTHNVYHFLKDRLHYSPAEDEKFLAFAELPENKDESWLANMEAYVENRLTEDNSHREPRCVNTYNGEDLVSQVLQFTEYTAEETESQFEVDYVLLQIHQGCDVRGGYTRPVAYEVSEEYALYDNCRATLWAGNTLDKRQLTFDGKEQDNSHSWYTDDGYHWYADDNGEQLESYTATDDATKRGDGVHLYIDDDGNGYSPINGALLKVSN